MFGAVDLELDSHDGEATSGRRACVDRDGAPTVDPGVGDVIVTTRLPPICAERKASKGDQSESHEYGGREQGAPHALPSMTDLRI
jgi:hypothetical protein